MNRFTGPDGLEYLEPEDGSEILPGDGFISSNDGVFRPHVSGSFGLARHVVRGTREARPVKGKSTDSLVGACKSFVSEDLNCLSLDDADDRRIAVALLIKFVKGLVDE